MPLFIDRHKNVEGLTAEAVAEAHQKNALDRDGKLAVLDFSRRLRKGEKRPNLAAIRLLDEWMADDSGYDEESWPDLKEALDRTRREAGQYCKLLKS